MSIRNINLSIPTPFGKARLELEFGCEKEERDMKNEDTEEKFLELGNDSCMFDEDFYNSF